MADAGTTELIFSLDGLDADAAARVAQEIANVSQVEDVSLAPPAVARAGAHKGGWTDIVVKLAPAALERLGAALAALFGLAGAPLPVIEVGTPNGPIRVPYDPRRQQLADVVTEVQRLVTSSGAKPA